MNTAQETTSTSANEQINYTGEGLVNLHRERNMYFRSPLSQIYSTEEIEKDYDLGIKACEEIQARNWYTLEIAYGFQNPQKRFNKVAKMFAGVTGTELYLN